MQVLLGSSTLRVVAWGVRARTMPITRQVTYKFVDDESGVVFRPPTSMVFNVGEESWLCIPPSNKLFAQFVAGATITWVNGRRAEVGIGDQTQNSCSLAKHNGYAELKRLRNEAHLRTSCCDTASKSSKAADAAKLKSIFGKRPAEEATGTEDAAAEDCERSVTVRNQVLAVADHTHLWPATARLVDDTWEGRVITITLGESEMKTLRPESAHEAVCCPCDVHSVSCVVEFLRARNHDGCFEPNEYHRTGKFIGRAKKYKHGGAHVNAADDADCANADAGAEASCA